MAVQPKETSILQAKIIKIISINEFYYVHGIMKSQNHKMMRNVTRLKFPNTGAPMYQARLYTSKVGDMKLYIDATSNAHRVRLLDIYAIPYKGSLRPYAKVSYIDRIREEHLSFKYLFDFPQHIRHYKSVPPELKKCRLSCTSELQPGKLLTKISEYFKRIVQSKYYYIKILDRENGHLKVELIDQAGKYLSQQIKEKFPELAEYQYSDEDEKQSCFIPFIQPPSGRLILSNDKGDSFNVKSNGIEKPFKESHSSIEIFKQCSRSVAKIDKVPRILHQLIRVKVISWCSPDSFYIIPYEPNFLGHAAFLEESSKVQNLTMVRDHNPNEKVPRFNIGQRCFFKNLFDSNLSSWLRGTIIEVPKDFGLDYTDWDSNNLPVLENPKKYVYRVRSIDYGFECCRSPSNIRRIRNLKIFERFSPFALRCKLFGIYPLEEDKDDEGRKAFSKSCINETDGWMRERDLKLENDRFTFFYVLFRSVLSHLGDMNDYAAHITLFHRIEKPRVDFLASKRCPARLDCLNTHLLDRGLASKYIIPFSVSSDVEVDEYLVNSHLYTNFSK